MDQNTPPSPSRWQLLRRVDALLRNVATSDGSAVRHRDLLWISAVAAATYGVAMGLFAATTRGWSGVGQLAAAALKVPLLFAITIAVTFPSFYVLSAVRGAHARAAELLALLLVGTALATSLLASLAPITVFFTLSTDSHAFMVVLSVAFFAIAALIGMRSVWDRGRPTFAAPTGDGETPRPSGTGPLRLWFVMAIVVGAQSSWILRPLIGRPNDDFALFESRESNAAAGFLEQLAEPKIR